MLQFRGNTSVFAAGGSREFGLALNHWQCGQNRSDLGLAGLSVALAVSRRMMVFNADAHTAASARDGMGRGRRSGGISAPSVGEGIPHSSRSAASFRGLGSGRAGAGGGMEAALRGLALLLRRECAKALDCRRGAQSNRSSTSILSHSGGGAGGNLHLSFLGGTGGVDSSLA